jgi:hypothetical protein
MQEIMNENVEQQKSSFQVEKKELLEKLDQIQSKLTEKE